MGLLNDDMRKSEVLWNNANLSFNSSHDEIGKTEWFFCHSREKGNPECASFAMDSRFRGNDRMRLQQIELWLFFCVS